MYDDKTTSQTKEIPCSDNIVQRKIVEMAADVSDQFLGREKIVQAKQFTFLLDESSVCGVCASSRRRRSFGTYLVVLSP